MKKIYSLAAGLILCGSIFGQSAYMPNMAVKQKGHLPANAKPPISNTNEGSRVSGSYRRWVEPVGDVMTNLGIDLTSASPQQDTFLDIVYQDSTVTVSDPINGTAAVSTIMLGSVLDPTSPNLDAGFDPITTKYDSYHIDSLQILASYVKVTPTIDTLYTWLVWGDTTNASVFAKRLDNATWLAPIGTWRTSVIGPAVTGAVAAAGNKVKPTAPASNMMLIKHVLTNADSSGMGAGYSHVITIALPTVANIPAGNKVSCFYTFVPGGSHALNACSYGFAGAPATQTTNGFAGLIWNQVSPAVTAVADYVNQQVDPQGWNMGATYDKGQRYAEYSAAFNNSILGDLTTAPLIYYSIYGVNTTGISEANNNFTLGQNMPNPFTNQTTIKYQLKEAAKSVSLVIYDVTGTKMFEKTQSNASEGVYSVDVDNVNFSSGIYFYSLLVDGSKVTKKMVVTK